MARILRGDIIWAALDPTLGNEQAGLRPVVVLSADLFNARSGTIIGVALTSKQPKVGLPLTMQLLEPKLPKKSWVKISQVRTLSVQRLGRKLGKASPQELDLIIEALNEIMGA